MVESILLKAIQAFGEDAQYGQLMEELGELIVAANHFKKGRLGKANLASEVADVLIMVDQLLLMAGISEYEVESARKYKIARLTERLNTRGVNDKTKR